MHDRIRAKPPTTDTDRWREGVIRGVGPAEGGVAVTVEPDDGTPVEVTVTEAVFELFRGRLTPPAVADEEAVGHRAWFR